MARLSYNFCGGVMMEERGDEYDEMRTVECLRGRLLAERAASKAARDQAEILAKRMIELEEQVAQEIMHRDSAEEMLRHALKKLGSSKVLHTNSVSSCENKFGSNKLDGHEDEDSDSTQCCSTGEIEERHGSEGNEGLLGCGYSDESVTRQGCWRSVNTMGSYNNAGSHQESKFQNLITDGRSSRGPNDQNSDDDDQLEYECDSLALVPASIWPSSENLRPESRKHAHEVLLSLRRVKEKLLHSSMERRVASFPHKELYGQ